MDKKSYPELMLLTCVIVFFGGGTGFHNPSILGKAGAMDILVFLPLAGYLGLMGMLSAFVRVD